MIKRMPGVCLGLLVLAVSLTLPMVAGAKPPDLPIDLEDMLPPQLTPDRDSSDLFSPLPALSEPQVVSKPMPEVLQPHFPPPPQNVWQLNESGLVVVPAGIVPAPPPPQGALHKLRPKVRRELATCILFGAHPLLVLTPVDQLIEGAEEENYRPICFTGFDFGLHTPRLLFDIICKEHVGLTGQQPCNPPANACKPLVFTCPMLGGEVQLTLGTDGSMKCKDVAGNVQEMKTGCLMFGLGVNTCAGLTGSIVLNERNFCTGVCGIHPTEPNKAQTPEQVGQKPQPVDCAQDKGCESGCPYMRLQMQCEQTPVEPMVNDVLTNLQNLTDADQLFKVAEDLRQRGQVCEALDLYELIGKLCPGSRFDVQVNQAMDKMFAAIYGHGEEAEAGTADLEKSAPAEEKEPGNWKDKIKGKLKMPVSLSIEKVPLGQVIDDLRTNQGFNVVVDSAALEDEGVSLDRPVTLKVEQVTLKSALKLMLHSAHLTYVLKDEVLLITTEKNGQVKHKKGEDKVGKATPGVQEEVTGLMKACRLAVEQGRPEKAVRLAREAYVLSPERVQADPLVCKMHLLKCGQKKGCCSCCPVGGCPECCETCSEGGCPNGCTKDKCGKGCPDGCTKPCGNGKCKCHEGVKGGEAGSEPVCPNGCPKEQCGKSCPDCCAQPCSDDTCKCHDEAGDCCSGKKKGGCHKGCGKTGGCHGPADSKQPSKSPSQSRRPAPVVEPALPPVDAELARALNKVLDKAETEEAEDLTAVIEEEEAPPMPQQPVKEKTFRMGRSSKESEKAAARTAYLVWDGVREFLGNGTCIDMLATTEQLRLSYQFKMGDKSYQIRYSPAGLDVQVQPAGMAEDATEFVPVD